MALYDGPAEKTQTLRKPVKLGDIEVTEWKLREPTGEEVSKFYKAAQAGREVDAIMELIAVVVGIDLPYVKKAGFRDIQEAQEFLQNFMDSGEKKEQPAS